MNDEIRKLIGSRRKQGFMRWHKNVGMPTRLYMGDGDDYLYGYENDKPTIVAFLCITGHEAKRMNDVEMAQMAAHSCQTLVLAFNTPTDWPTEVGKCEDLSNPFPIYVFTPDAFNSGPAERAGKHVHKLGDVDEYCSWEEAVRHGH